MTVAALTQHGYRDIALVGAGGLGDVYRAVRASTGGLVAIKVVREPGDSDATDRRVRRELQALLKLKGHPNVVQIEELLPLPTGLALVMEFVSGGSLMDLLTTSGRLSPAQCVAVMSDVTRAVGDAHALGIVHRDIKPHNVMVGQFGQCKVCDFGIAAVLKDTAYTDRTSALSYRYASPEELEDADDIGPATDIYSLGVTLRQLCTGETSEARAASVAAAAANDAGWTVAQRGTFKALQDLVIRMTARVSSERPSATTVLTFIRELERALGSERVISLLPSLIEEEPEDTRPTEVRPSRRPPVEATPPPDDRTIVRPRSPDTLAPAPRALPNPTTTPDKWWETT